MSYLKHHGAKPKIQEVGVMQVYLELNQRYGTGYQVRVLAGPVDKLYNEEPLTLYEAGNAAGIAIDGLNRVMGTSYEPHQVIRITEEALQANAGRDLASAKMLKDIQNGTHEYSSPADNDFKKDVIDGEEQFLLSGRGTVLTIYFCWKDDKNKKARESLLRYCQYIASHGYKRGATKALNELGGLDKDRAAAWIKKTYARHVKDDAALIEYILNP